MQTQVGAPRMFHLSLSHHFLPLSHTSYLSIFLVFMSLFFSKELTLLLSLDYMAPEMARNEPSGPPIDIWSTGVMTYHLLSGRMPFQSRVCSIDERKRERERERENELEKERLFL